MSGLDSLLALPKIAPVCLDLGLVSYILGPGEIRLGLESRFDLPITCVGALFLVYRGVYAPGPGTFSFLD